MPLKILTTDSEFHSFSRQLRRLEESGFVEAYIAPTQPFKDFAQRFERAGREGDFDLVYFSHVFFNSGFMVPDVAELAANLAKPETIVMVDGYHAFMARPVDWSAAQDKAFYLSGGYKYAMAGEGVCFMHCPKNILPRPLITGWFAAFDALESGNDDIPYPAHGGRFMGSTFDPVGLYRLNAVFAFLQTQGIAVADTHAHVQTLQEQFIDGLKSLNHPDLNPTNLLVNDPELQRGNFLAFEAPQAAHLYAQLHKKGITTDYRGNTLRFGFGVYHTPQSIECLLAELKRLA